MPVMPGAYAAHMDCSHAVFVYVWCRLPKLTELRRLHMRDNCRVAPLWAQTHLVTIIRYAVQYMLPSTYTLHV